MNKLSTIFYSLLFTSICLSFTFKAAPLEKHDISGKWKLEIDNLIDGKISGNNGCSEIIFYTKEPNVFTGEYSKCGAASRNAKPSQFSGEIYISKKGNLINMVHDNFSSTNYYSAWSGKFLEDNHITGIWTDLEGRQGEFKLTR